MSKILDAIYETERGTVEMLYDYEPFSQNRKRQYPGNVIQYLLMEVAQIDTSKNHDGYTQAEWIDYKINIFNKVSACIGEQNINTFLAKDCAISMHRIAVILTSDMKNIALPSGLNLLLRRLHEQRAQAKPQEIANALWSIAKLVESGKLAAIDAVQVNGLLTRLHEQRAQAKPQEIANVLWSIAKLVESGKLAAIDAVQVNGLLARLHEQRAQAKPQEIANVLWSIAKLVESGKLAAIDAVQMNGLLTRLHEQRAQAKPQEIANVLWSIAKLVESGKLAAINAVQVNGLLTRLHEQRAQAKPQEIANVLWSIAKLVESGKLAAIDAVQVNGLLARLHEQRAQAKPQNVSNALWSVAKLVESGKLAAIDADQVNGLLARLHEQRAQAKPQEIANVLWSIAKLVESGKLAAIDAVQVNGLLTRLHEQHAQASTQGVANALWSIGIISTMISTDAIRIHSDSFNALVMLAIKIANEQTTLIKEKKQIITGIDLLGLRERYDISAIVSQCRPKSVLQLREIAPYIKSAKKYEIESFVCGFFVDLLVVDQDGNKQIIEFDGRYHQQAKQRSFDEFRDKILKNQGYCITRVEQRGAVSKDTVRLFQQVVAAVPSENLCTDSRVFVSGKGLV